MDKNIDFSSKFRSANILSLLIFIMSVLFILFKGLNYGIDFKGGTLIELRTDSKNVNISEIRSSLNSMNLGDVNVKEFGKEGDYLIKVEQKTENNNQLIPEIKKTLINKLNAEINFRRVENVGPKVSSELLQSGIIAISLSLIAMLFYIWIRFEWQFSIGSIVALFHDVIITIGIFSILSLEINLSIIAAVLTIVGYSMNDTVVIYDRIRENLNKHTRLNISETSNLSINETLSRTIITSLTTLLALLSIYILGGEILRGFSFAMILGVLIGTYSSIFVAAPVLKFFKVSYKTLEKKEEKIVP
jgi:preprotein translocase SecF subunit